jgi:hypothetical protein
MQFSDTEATVLRRLRRCQPLIREFCLRHGLPYCQTSLAGCIRPWNRARGGCADDR